MSHDPRFRRDEQGAQEVWFYIREKLAELVAIAQASDLDDLARQIQRAADLDSPAEKAWSGDKPDEAG